MSIGDNYKARFANLDNSIATLTQNIASLEAEKRSHSKVAEKMSRQLAYLRFSRWLRSPGKDYSLWRPGLLMVGAAVAGVVCFIFLDCISLSTPFTIGGSIAGSMASFALITTFFSYPADSLLPDAIADRDIECTVEQ